MTVEQTNSAPPASEPTARVALVEPIGIAELAGLVPPADRDVVLPSNALTRLILDAE
jgi:hypothetical protein